MNIKMKKIGAERYRQVLFDTKVQQRLSMSRYKRLTIQIGELSLEGLDIDWHLAEYDYSVELPMSAFSPSPPNAPSAPKEIISNSLF